MSWKPIYTDQAEIEKINLKIDEIANELTKCLETETDPSLMTGYMGIAIFFVYYGRFRNSDHHLELGVNTLSQAIDAINETNLSSIAFAGGISGICWGIQHLMRENFVDADPDELFNDIDDVIGEITKQQLKDGYFDYLHGGMGPLLYLLHRHKENCNEHVQEALKALEKAALKEENADTVRWVSTVTWNGQQVNAYNLSLSHGISSIINILSRCLPATSGSSDVADYRELLTRSLNYLKHQQNEDGATSFFPLYILEESGASPESSKMAWCYGDLGVAISLLYVSIQLGDEQLKQYSLHIFKQIDKREKSQTEGIRDGALCHGTGGIAHMYQRAFNYTGDEQFRKLARTWCGLTLDFAYHTDGLAGYKSGVLDGFENEAGLLEGIAGIGLMLLSAISDIEPKWDECLLLS